ncbi:V-type ATP synthase subunit F [Lentzea sp. NPDC004782]|uniref:V-type ATP synthase subunit F n=1 Tax=Lentzea sp. NPDC004782 TaxID=3154458 RepID=UPI0033BAC151
MGAVAVIGAGVADWALAGVRVREATEPASVHQAWNSLGDDVSVVLLTDAAAAVLNAELAVTDWPLVVVIPS